MDTKALRQKILDLAIHGKLVPQNPNDEPASVLLERIRAEKERLIKEGKIKKGKTSAKTSDKPHYPYELPKGWEWTTVGEISQSILYGVSESAKSHGAYKLLRITDIQNNFVNWETVPFTDYDESKAESYLLKDGDILFARTGATVGKSYLVNSLQENTIYASYLIRVQTYNQVLPEFVKYFFESGYYWSQILCNSVGIGQPNVNGTILANLMLPIPPIKEQKRIVKELTKWLSIIDKIARGKESLQDVIKQAKSKILNLAIHGKLVPQDPNDEPAIELLKRINPKAEIISDNGHYQKLPSGWCMTNIESLFEAVSAKRVLKSEWKNKGIPFYRAREIVQLSKEGIADKNLFVSEEHYSELKEKYGVPNCDDIMISAVGSIGYTYIVKKGDVFYYKDASVLCLKNTNHWNPTFFKIWLASPFLQEQMYKNSKGTTVNTITLEKLKGYVIPFPPITEQHRIVSKIEGLFSLLDNIASSL